MLSTQSWLMDLTALYNMGQSARPAAAATEAVTRVAAPAAEATRDSLPAARETSSPEKIAA